MKYFEIILVFVLIFSAISENEGIKRNKTVLIVGTSFPGLTAGMILNLNGYNVTFLYEEENFENQFSSYVTDIKGVKLSLPKKQPIIFENSLMTRQMINFLKIKTHMESTVNIRLDNGKILQLTENQYRLSIMIKALESHCIHFRDLLKARQLETLMEHFQFAKYQSMYSSVSLLQTIRSMNLPQNVVSCFLDTLLLTSGMMTSTINTADAMGRAHFYYLGITDALLSYYLLNSQNNTDNANDITSILVKYLKGRKNVQFKPKTQIDAFHIDPINNLILGNLKTKNEQYGYVVLGADFNKSKSLISSTAKINTGVDKIFSPLNKTFTKMLKLTYNRNVATVNVFLNKSLNVLRPNVMYIQNSPFPWSIQSIKQLNKLNKIESNVTVLEILVNTNNYPRVSLEKIKNEMLGYFPELKGGLLTYRYHILDSGVLQDTAYGLNRIHTNSIKLMGINNFFLASDWVDLADEAAWDIEKLAKLGLQAANSIIHGQ